MKRTSVRAMADQETRQHDVVQVEHTRHRIRNIPLLPSTRRWSDGNGILQLILVVRVDPSLRRLYCNRSEKEVEDPTSQTVGVRAAEILDLTPASFSIE
jgi:hypothetical protein